MPGLQHAICTTGSLVLWLQSMEDRVPACLHAKPGAGSLNLLPCLEVNKQNTMTTLTRLAATAQEPVIYLIDHLQQHLHAAVAA